MRQNTDPDYQTRILTEKRIFQDYADVHGDLPAIFHYWSDKYIRPKGEAFGFVGPTGLFEKYLSQQCRHAPDDKQIFASIGSGNCDFEIDLAQRLHQQGLTNFVMDCVDLNPAMLARGKEAAAQCGAAAHFCFVEADFNRWKPEHPYNAVIANQSLHHVMDLENLFGQIRASLAPGGQFIISDMIGRNGHLRWPEAMEIVQEFWKELPRAYRYNHPLKRYEETYEDWDCSTEGFEGIRAQDILPLLIEYFHFELFVGFANVIAPFVDRAFGQNFNVQSEWDRNFIDRVHLRDEQEMRAGKIKPTQMLAVVGIDNREPTQFLPPLSPEFCVRYPDPLLASPAPREGDGPSAEILETRSRNQPSEEVLHSKSWELDRELKAAHGEISKLRANLEIATGQIDRAANSKWLRLGRSLGLGPKLR